MLPVLAIVLAFFLRALNFANFHNFFAGCEN